MKRKIWTGIIFFALLINTVFLSQSLAANLDFPDVKGHWAQEYITRLSSAGYVNGYPDGTFKPERNMSKAEFVTILISCKGIQAADTTSANYKDTNYHWAKAQINEAVKLGILVPSEDPNGFYPDDSIKRSQAAAMLVRALGKQPDSGTLSFNDRANIEKSMYRGYIKTAYDLGLITGFPNGNFEPFQTMTRAQVSTVISRYLDLQPVSSPLKPGSINTVIIDDESFNIYTTPIYFKVNFIDTKAASLSTSQGYLTLNGSQRFKLDSTTNNPDIIVNNNRYGVNKMTVKGNELLVYPSSRKINRFTYGTYSFNSDYVKLYINSANSELYLSDLEIIDEYTVKIAGNTYDLSRDKITIALNQDFCDITKIEFNTAGTTPQLVRTDPVIFQGMALSDIMAIFTGTSTLNLSSINNIDFILGGKRYNMSEVVLDAKGNFTAAGKTYSPADVVMIIDGIQYNINHIEVSNAKFIIYAGEGSSYEWVLINNEYRNPEDIKILWSGDIYDMDDVLVVSRNLLRIDGRQYELDSSFKVRFDNKTYDIDQVDYDPGISATIIRTGSISTGYLANQPDKYVFFKDGWEYQEGTSDTTIYVNGSWVDFDKIIILDPSHFTYKGTNYNLIDARVKIDQTEFYVVDTAWHGLHKVMDIYLEE